MRGGAGGRARHHQPGGDGLHEQGGGGGQGAGGRAAGRGQGHRVHQGGAGILGLVNLSYNIFLGLKIKFPLNIFT